MHREGHMKMEAETGVMQLQAKEHQGFPRAPSTGRGKEGSSPRALWEHGLAGTLILDF